MKAGGLMPEDIGKVICFVNPDDNGKVGYIMGSLEFATAVENKIHVRFKGDPDLYVITSQWEMLGKEHF